MGSAVAGSPGRVTHRRNEFRRTTAAMTDTSLVDVIGRVLGFSFAAGINLYATVAMLGLATRFGWVDLPPQYRVFDNNWIIGAAIVLYLVEFVADKIPWLDSLWDAVHTVVRPAGGALIA